MTQDEMDRHFPYGALVMQTIWRDRKRKITFLPFRWIGEVDGIDYDITVPKGFIFDGASIPRFFWRVIGGPFGPYVDAAVVHDYIYAEAFDRYTKQEADSIFLRIMELLGIKAWRRKAMYRAVKWFGKGGWT